MSRPSALAILALLCASPALADGTWFVRPLADGAFGYDAASLSADAQGMKLITAGLYMNQPVEIRGKQVRFIVQDAKVDCAGGRFAVGTYTMYDADFALVDTSPDNGWQNIADDPMMGDLRPAACERKPLAGAKSADGRDAALRLMKSIGG